jgi:hypothetical protein
MERVGYTFSSAHLGLEWCSRGRFTFFVRGGASVVLLDLPDLNGLDEPYRQTLGRREARGGGFRFVIPSAKLGLTLYFG